MAKVSLPDDFYEQTPDGSKLATEAVMNTIRTADLLFDRIGQLLRPLGVSSAGGLVLGQLRDHGSMSPSELGERLIVTRATVTGVVDSLERRGYVSRSPNPKDRRGIIVELTATGLEIVAQVRTLIHRQEREWMGALSEDELAAYINLMHRVQDRVAAGESPGAGTPER
jgi:DNA-binding MarR family transcriptional regulator